MASFPCCPLLLLLLKENKTIGKEQGIFYGLERERLVVYLIWKKKEMHRNVRNY